jgi:ribosome-binding protein aMBF1 (putative translation factor)
MIDTIHMTIAGREYIAVPRVEFERLTNGAEATSGNVDALPYAMASLARDLLAARKAGGLTQVQLAEKMGKSQSTVAMAEAGKMRVSVLYVERVLKACGLPKDWAPKKNSCSKRVKNR